MRTIILYASDDGQTEKIAHYIGAGLRSNGQVVTISAIKDLKPDFQLIDYNQVIVGASIHMSRYQAHVVKWVKDYLPALQQIPNAFFSVCMAASDTTAAGQSEAQNYINTFVNQTGWTPDKVSSFGGALMFSKYGFFKRFLLMALVRSKALEIDTSRNTEFTDWRHVDNFIALQSTV